MADERNPQRAPISFDSMPVDAAQFALLAELRAAFYGVTAVLEKLPTSRFRSVAETNLEQAAMWASKAVTHGGKG